MRVVIVGRGAIGAIYCAAFSNSAHCQLRVAVDSARALRYVSEPFYYNGEELKLDYFIPNVGDNVGDSVGDSVGDIAVDELADLVIIATKWDGYRSALESIAPVVGEDTLILPLLNGLLPYEVAVERYGESRVLRGYYVGQTASREGSSATLEGRYRTVFGEESNVEGCYSERVNRVIDIFEKVGVSYRVDDDMVYSRWLKFVINSGLNQVSALGGGLSYGDISSSQQMSTLCRALMDEAAQVAAAVGVVGAQAMADRAMEMFTTLRGGDYSSMAQDVRAGRATEWELFGGYLIVKAAELGVPVVLHQLLEKEMKIINE